MVKAVNELLGNKNLFFPILQKNNKSVIVGDSAECIKAVDIKLSDMQKKLLKTAEAKKDYEPIVKEIDRLRDEKQSILVDDAERKGTRQQVQETKGFL